MEEHREHRYCAADNACETVVGSSMAVVGTEVGNHPECGSHGAAGPEINQRKRRGTPRPGNGGARPGAGRKRKPLTVKPVQLSDDAEGDWYCAEVWPHRELVAGEQLRRLGFDTYVPIGEDVDERGESVRGPMFPGYVLVRFGVETLITLARQWSATLERAVTVSVLDAPEIQRLICRPDGTPHPIPAAEVERLMRRAGDDGLIRIAKDKPADPLDVGVAVRIVDGPLASFPGIVLHVGDRLVRVDVSIFGRSTEVTLRRAAVEAVGRP